MQPTDEGSADEPFRWSVLVFGVPRAVWAITVLLGGLLLAWSLIAPIYDAPDEPQHTDLVLEVRSTWRYPAYDQLRLTEQMLESFAVMGWSDDRDPHERTRGPVVAVDALPRAERPSFDELGSRAPTEFYNPAPQHPPLYYTLAALWLRIIPTAERLAFDQVTWLLRLFSIITLLPVPVLTYATARRLTGRIAPGLTAALLLLALPMLTHVGASVSNDNLLTAALACLTLLLVHVATGDLSRRTAVWVGVITGAALLTKGFALFAPLWILSAYLIGWARTGRLRAAVEGTVLAGAVLAVLGGWWWVANLVRFGTVQPSVQRFHDANPGFDPRVAEWFDRAWTFLAQRFWGSFGWVEVSLSDEFVNAATWTLAILLAVAFVIRRRTHPWWRADMILLLIPVVCIFSIVAYGSWDTYAQSGRLVGMQGRYLFPGAPGMAVTVAVGLSALVRRFDRALPPVALITAALVQWSAGIAVLFHFYGHVSFGDPRVSGPAVLAWSPWARPVTISFAVVFILGALWAAVELVLVAARSPEAFDDERGTPDVEPVG